jgi:hypothetical protein
MKKLVFFLFNLFFSVLFLSCSHDIRGGGINGECFIVEDIEVTHELVGEEIKLNDPYYGIMSIVDSVMFFYDPTTSSAQHYCFDIETGEKICDFFPVGRGPNEFLNVTPIMQVYEENGEKKSVFTAINEEKAGVFNITKSVEQRKTVLDSVFDLEWRKYFTRSFVSFFRNDETSFWVFRQPERTTLNDHHYSLPQYVKINYHDGEIKKVFDIYTNPPIYNKEAERLNEDFYLSFNMIHPDNNKIAMAMGMLAQINILDLDTGDLRGIKIAGTPDFAYLSENPENFKQFYTFSDADNNYIYGLYMDKKIAERKESWNADIVNVFDWDGNFAYKLHLDNGVDQIRIDSGNRSLYAINYASLQIFKYELPF